VARKINSASVYHRALFRCIFGHEQAYSDHHGCCSLALVSSIGNSSVGSVIKTLPITTNAEGQFSLTKLNQLTRVDRTKHCQLVRQFSTWAKLNNKEISVKQSRIGNGTWFVIGVFSPYYAD
jgi:hypothetical protein